MKDTDKNKTEDEVETDAATEPTSEIPSHDQEFKRLQQERDELETKLQHAMADLANVRRRQRQEIDDNRHRVLEGLTQELLPVLDTFSMAVQAYDAQQAQDARGEQSGSAQDPKALVEGVRMVRTMLSSVLERHGLQEIPGSGPFDPNRHEAMAMEPSEDVPDGHIVRVMLTGYQLGDKVVRHSRVVVAGSDQAAGDPADEPAED